MKKYKTPTNIIWRKSEANDSKFNSSRILVLKNWIQQKNKTIGDCTDDYFCLKVDDIIINKKLIGYIFKLD